MRIMQVAALTVGVLTISVPSGLDSCGIAPPTPVFATSQRPADEDQFLKGKLGVLRRSYQQRYLIGAFRILSGVPLTGSHVEALYNPISPEGNPYERPGLNGWISVRRDVAQLAEVAAPNPYKNVLLDGLFYSFVNCHEDAFFKATATLNDLYAKWGAHDPRTLDWIRAQDQVFANCSAGVAAIPAAPATGMDPLLASHRRYQIGAAYFYAGQFRKASETFQHIAEEKQSPWRGIAPYLVARALLRAGMFDGDRDAFREGKDRLLAILKDPKQQELHESSLGLLHLWQIRVEPRVRLAELGEELMKPGEDDVSQSIVDFLYLVNRRQDASGRRWSPSELTEAVKSSDLAAWLLSMSGRPAPGAGEYSLERWLKTRNPAWLISGLANAQGKDLPELLKAAAQIPPNASAYESVAYYAISREIERGQKEQARRWADRALSHNLQPSSRNLILALRTRIARDWNEFLRFGLRRPERNIEEFEGAEIVANETPISTAMTPVFDWDVIADFNQHVPLALWVDASANPLLPAHMQLRIAQAGWLRAVLLGREEEARKLMQRVVELQPGSAEVARGFLDAHDPEEARFAAIVVILRAPSVRPTLQAPEFRTANLAAPGRVATDAYGRRIGCWYPRNEQQPEPPSRMNSGFLTVIQHAAGESEWKQIRASEPWEATYLAHQTLDWARKHPDDPRVPESLHRAVQASYYRCTDADTGKYSKQVFVLLHQRYPQSKWTAQTKYWYK